MSEEAKVQESGVFNMAPEGEPEDLRDAWGRKADSDEAVEFEEEKYNQYTVAQLKEELRRRETELGREFDKSNIRTKSQLVAALKADDAAHPDDEVEPEPEDEE